ncbi:TetR family transcriptional regulator [Streptomyces sp. AC512_CC834]|uniref:TetR/AcrR family transcriptional regulator n=1 Tax=Streptomyces sp. AC512_CC834 TaxID=2823691 RepID=UPI0027E42F47|nr:TetR family transcriptional regulator [Streptomyces sp. AC512_CC834]
MEQPLSDPSPSTPAAGRTPSRHTSAGSGSGSGSGTGAGLHTGAGAGSRTGRTDRSRRTREAILCAARLHFAADGYQRATIRAIAATASIDPSMVMRHFGSKERLFDAVLDVDLGLPDFTGTPLELLPRALLIGFLAPWEEDTHEGALRLLLRSAATNEQAAECLRRILHEQFTHSLTGVLGAERAAAGSGLLAAQLLGVAFARYLLRLRPICELPVGALADLVAPAMRTVLAATG